MKQLCFLVTSYWVCWPIIFKYRGWEDLILIKYLLPKQLSLPALKRSLISTTASRQWDRVARRFLLCTPMCRVVTWFSRDHPKYRVDAANISQFLLCCLLWSFETLKSHQVRQWPKVAPIMATLAKLMKESYSNLSQEMFGAREWCWWELCHFVWSSHLKHVTAQNSHDLPTPAHPLARNYLMSECFQENWGITCPTFAHCHPAQPGHFKQNIGDVSTTLQTFTC